MSFVKIFGQWNQLDTKTERKNPTEIKFPTVNGKIRKKRLLNIQYRINKRLTVPLATKYRLT